MKLIQLASSLSIALFAFCAGAQAASGTAIPGGTVSTTYVISQPGAYYLAGNRTMTDITKHAILIQSDDVTLDLNGYAISFSSADTTSSTACGIETPNSNVEVRNGSIFNVPGHGVRLDYGIQCRVINVRVSGAKTGAGIWAAASGSLVRNCEVFNCHIGIDASFGCVVENCRVLQSAGTGISSSDACIVRSCIVETATGAGISTGQASLVEANTVLFANTGNGSAGIVAIGNGATVRGNNVERCNVCSIYFYGKSVAEGNTIFSSDASHIALKSGSSEAALYRNNNISAKTAASGAWVNAGGNVMY